MLRERILQVLVLAGTWVGWDLHLKDWFLDLISGESVGLAEIFIAYITPFVLAFVLSTVLIRLLGLNQPERSDSYG